MYSKLSCGDGIKRLHEVDCRKTHSVSRLMIHRLVGAPEPSLIFGLNLIKSGIKSVVQDSRKTVCTALAKMQIGRQFPTYS